jgi:hypothetical protein
VHELEVERLGGAEPVGSIRGRADARGSQSTLVALGLRYQCWRCHRWGTVVIGVSDLRHLGDCAEIFTAEDEDVLAIAADALDAATTRAHKIGTIKERFSKTLGCSYLANGCHHCDAIVGNFPLFHEALPEALATLGRAAFVELGWLELDDDAWRDLCAHSPYRAMW